MAFMHAGRMCTKLKYGLLGHNTCFFVPWKVIRIRLWSRFSSFRLLHFVTPTYEQSRVGCISSVWLLHTYHSWLQMLWPLPWSRRLVTCLIAGLHCKWKVKNSGNTRIFGWRLVTADCQTTLPAKYSRLRDQIYCVCFKFFGMLTAAILTAINIVCLSTSIRTYQ